jgi:hypothetical protein
MKLKQFIEENNVTAYEIVPEVVIMSAVVGETSYGLNVDTSNIVGGTLVIRFENFSLEGEILTVDGLSLNINEVDMLGSDI